MSDNSDISAISRNVPNKNKVMYRQVKREDFDQMADINPKIITKDQLDSFKLIIRDNILESIINGF